MSWDLYLESPCCQIEVADLGNLTYNLSAMMSEADIHPKDDLADKTGKDLAFMFLKALQDMVINPEKYKIHNPPNGWGDYDHLLERLKEWLNMVIDHPNAILRVS